MQHPEQSCLHLGQPDPANDVALVHMNGRVYDPYGARFLSADPFIQDVSNLQGYNRYSYVYNNPLALTDPTGYFSLSKFFKKFARPAAGIAIGYFTGAGMLGWAQDLFGQVAGGALAGSAGGFAGGLVASGGHIKSALQGAFSGAVFGAIGSYGKVNTWGDYDVRYVVAHSAGGCVTSAASGGGCASGALAAGFAKYTTLAIDVKFSGEGFRENVLNGVATVVAGGTASVLGGGKFENGAITAAYAYLFNQAMHGGRGGGPKQPGWGYEYPDVDHPFAPNAEFKARFFGSEEERQVWFRTQEIASGAAETREWLRYDDPKVQLPRSGGTLYQIFDLGLPQAGSVRIAYSPKIPSVFYVSLDHYQPTPAQPLRWTRFEASLPKN